MSGWAFLTRAGGEGDLLDELGASSQARRIVEGVVLASARPRARDGSHQELAFGRQALRVAGRFKAVDGEGLAKALAGLLPRRADPSPYILQIVAPDSREPHDPRRRIARALDESLPAQLDAILTDDLRAARRPEEANVEWLLQVWVLDANEVLYGLTPAGAALSTHAAGKMRLKRPDDALSRSGLKLEEAIHWVGLGPDKGDLCVDLGAAPGGWSQVVLERGAAVIAIDPAVVKLGERHNKFTHLKQSAFDFVPSEPVDWLLCDMAWRPFEVAQLIAKWGRRGWTRQLIVNFKLPMKQKVSTIGEILAILRDAGWEGLKARQLYHDRDEITVFGWVNAGIVSRGAQPAFELRSHRKHVDRAKRGEAPLPRRPREEMPKREPKRGPRRGPRPNAGKPKHGGRGKKRR